MKTKIPGLFRTCLTAVVVSVSWSTARAALFPAFSREQGNITNKLETIDWDDFYADMSEIGEDESLLEQWSESVRELVENPLDLNSATRQELADLPFMNDKLVEEISYYLYRYGPMKDLAELRLIEGMDDIRYRLLCHLVYPGDSIAAKKTVPSWKTMLKRGKHDFRFQMGTQLERKKGFRQPHTERQRYLGDAWCSTMRYGFNYKRNLLFGFTTQKDAGEPWLDSHFRPDYASAHLLVKDIGWCNALVLGDYSLTLGQGLICGQSFLVGKGSFAGNPGSAASPVKRHASSGESNYFKGMAFDIDLLDHLYADKKSLTISLIGFYSKQHIDGSIDGNTLTAIVSTGLHRTPDELEQRHNVSLLSTGWSLGIKTRWGRFNVNHLNWKLDKPLCPTWHPYNQFQLQGSKGNNTSLDYRFLVHRITCFGEVAVDQDLDYAFQCGCCTMPLSSLSLTVHYRNHGIKYNAWHAGAFGENSRANNEHGFYASLVWEATRQLTLSGYADMFLYPWLTYRCDEPSSGNQLCIQGTFQLSPSTSFLVRFKEKSSLYNLMALERKNPLIAESVQRHIRLQLTESRELLEMRTIVDATQAANPLEKTLSRGYSLSQSIEYTPRRFPVKATAKVACFDIPAYENRITAFEPSLPGSSRFPTLYGEGCRLNLLCSYTMSKSIQWWLDVSRWNYTNQSQVGTGLEEVEGNHLTTVQLLFRLKI